jgi:hypothetical protein
LFFMNSRQILLLPLHLLLQYVLDQFSLILDFLDLLHLLLGNRLLLHQLLLDLQQGLN